MWGRYMIEVTVVERVMNIEWMDEGRFRSIKVDGSREIVAG